MITKNKNITNAIRTIKTILKSKIDHSKIVKLIHSYNKNKVAKYKAQHPDLSHYEAERGCILDMLKYPEWIEGHFNIKSYYYHGIVNTHFCIISDLKIEGFYVTALHIAYLRLRNSTKEHTSDDSEWVKKYSWDYKRLTKQLSEIFDLPEFAFSQSEINDEVASHGT